MGFQYGVAALGVHELNLFQNPDVNLASKNYAAADYIIQQAETFIRPGDLIKVTPLVNFEDPETPAAIGSLIPEQIGARLTQLGYNVDLSDVSAQKKILNMNDMVTGTSATRSAPKFVLGGHYLDDRPNMNVSMRITKISTNRVVGAFDYTMPTNREIRELSAPKPQIMIMKKPGGTPPPL
ncbi:FlgO family outer membrane protein [Alphaproteobacteria bacterium]|nr:FlgO family outer membrane protein [Alphaproteobacteria bacterium]